MSGISDFHAFAHDLRHFLRLIVGQCEIALARDLENGLARETFQRIAAAGSTCDALVRAMAALEDADASRLPPLPIAHLVQGVVFDMRASFEAAGGALETAGDGSNRRVPGAIRDLLVELLSNAVKFRDLSRRLAVTVSWAVDSDQFSVSVLDNGIGLPENQREKIFVPFYRLHRRDQYPGFGLGLAKVRKLARQLSGDVECVSGRELGALFQIRIPLTSLEAQDNAEEGVPS